MRLVLLMNKSETFVVQLRCATPIVQILGLWRNSVYVNVGVAMKSGPRLTYQQYEGMRYILSHHFDDAKRCYICNEHPLKIMKQMVDATESGQIEGKYHFQILADGVSWYRHISVCNVDINPEFQFSDFNETCVSRNLFWYCFLQLISSGHVRRAKTTTRT